MAANGLAALTRTIGLIIGPLLAGVTVEALGVKAAFVVDGVAFLIAAALVGTMTQAPPLENAPAGGGGREVLNNVKEGLLFIAATPLLLATTISFSILQGGLGGIYTLWVPFLRETFGVGPIGITLVDSLQGVGMALGAVVLGYLMARASKADLLWVDIVGIGAAFMVMGWAPAFWIVLAASFVLGLMVTPASAAFDTLLQLATPGAMQGRVFSSLFAITQTAAVAMVSVVTALAAVAPMRWIYISGGAAVVASGLLWAVWVREDTLALEERSAGGEASSGD